ncbi:hypothetical protein [Novosphingobium album (ex Liu et al. 2023)]|nr:hypothetical protein [Novosphingobium album (ex Liu et al. 2023)]
MPDLPVRIGGAAELDACGSLARVARLKRGGENFLSVRARPSPRARELDRLGPGRLVWICDAAMDGAWTGIVYAPAAGDADCGVGSPVPHRRAYAGTCASGWVASRFLEGVAG